MYTSMQCPTCGKEDDSQEHPSTCESTGQHLTNETSQLLGTLYYNDLFRSIDRQVKVAKMFRRDNQYKTEYPEGPRPTIKDKVADFRKVSTCQKYIIII